MVINPSVDRRGDGRLRMNTASLLFDKKIHKEMTVVVNDISESGISFKIDNQYRKLIDVGDILEFQFIDKYMFGTKEQEEVVDGRCTVKHIEEYRNRKHFVVGCLVCSPSYTRYVDTRKTAEEVNNRLALVHKQHSKLRY